MQKKVKIALGASLFMVAGAAGLAMAAKGDGNGPPGGWRGPHGAGPDGFSGEHMRWTAGHFGRFFGGGMTQAQFDEKARSRFARIDRNSDGILDEAEILASLEARRERRHRRWGGRHSANRGMAKHWQRRLARLDSDGDGKISKAEFDAHAGQRFARFDLNNDGRISDVDLPPWLRGRGILNADASSQQWMGMARAGHGWHRRGGRLMRGLMRLAAADTNNDGAVSLDEAMALAAGRFQRMDANGDGSIDAADRQAHRKANLDYRVKRFIHRFGRQADEAGKVTHAEFDKVARQRFARLDLDKNGKITRNERRGGRLGHRGWHHRGWHHHGHHGRDAYGRGRQRGSGAE